jgi:hypothetical protein
LAQRRTGYYSHFGNVKNTVLSYEQLRSEALRKRNYVRAAYIEGYMDGHVFFVADDEMRRHVPRFLLYGYDRPISSITGLPRLLSRAARFHKGAAAAAERTVA